MVCRAKVNFWGAGRMYGAGDLIDVDLERTAAWLRDGVVELVIEAAVPALGAPVEAGAVEEAPPPAGEIPPPMPPKKKKKKK